MLCQQKQLIKRDSNASLCCPAVLLPPLGVFLEKQACDKDMLINILLTVLGYIPGGQWQQPKVVQLSHALQQKA